MGTLALIVAPDEDDDEAAAILVDGAVDGHPYRFLLDTGAARTSLRYDAYTATLPRIGAHTSSGVFAAGAYDLIAVPRVELGPISRSDVTLVRAPEGSHDRGNLIGMDLLRDRRCHFLFGENRLVIDSDDGPANGAEATRLLQPLFLDGKAHPYIEVSFGEVSFGVQTAMAVWDTGAGITVADASFIEQHPAHFQAVGYSTGTDSTGTEQRTPMYLMAATTIGGRAFPPLRVAGVDLSAVNAGIERPMDLILGYNALRKAHWLIDFPRKTWAILRMLG
jgi:hypothetical protein